MKQKKYCKDRVEMMHMSWCLKNDIKIYIQPFNSTHGNIVVEDAGKPVFLPEDYKLDNTVPRRRLKKGETRPINYERTIKKLYTKFYEERKEHPERS